MPFSTIIPIAELNSAFADEDLWLSPDGRTIYFSSDRTGNREIHIATR